MMSSLETSSPVSASTFMYLMRWPVFRLIWLKLIFSESEVAGYKATGQVTRERRKKPFQLARGAIEILQTLQNADSRRSSRVDSDIQWGLYSSEHPTLAACQFVHVCFPYRDPEQSKWNCRLFETKSNLGGAKFCASERRYRHFNERGFQPSPPKSCWPGCFQRSMTCVSNATGRCGSTG